MSIKKKIEELNLENQKALDKEASEVTSDEVSQTTDDTEVVKESVKAVYDKEEKIAIASTDVVDRHGERINQEGWDLKNFKKNPVMLWAHDHKEIAVGVCKNIQIQRSGGSPRLVFTPEFHDKTDKAKALKALFEEGWLNSFSVGFIPKEFDGKENMYTKQELLEISAVNVPANPDARMLAYKALEDKGFKKSVAKELLGEVTDKEREVAKEIPVVKGPVGDEIQEEEMWEKKHEMMDTCRKVWWAFVDVYFDEETPVEDFNTLLTETIDLLKGCLDNGEKQTDDSTEKSEATEEKDDVTEVEEIENSEVLDKVEDSVNDDNKPSKSEDETSSQAKTQDNKETSVAPEKEKRAKLELTKVIIRSSDTLLAQKNTEAEKMLKIIKRAAEILQGTNKRD